MEKEIGLVRFLEKPFQFQRNLLIVPTKTPVNVNVAAQTGYGAVSVKRGEVAKKVGMPLLS